MKLSSSARTDVSRIKITMVMRGGQTGQCSVMGNNNWHYVALCYSLQFQFINQHIDTHMCHLSVTGATKKHLEIMIRGKSAAVSGAGVISSF